MRRSTSTISEPKTNAHPCYAVAVPLLVLSDQTGRLVCSSAVLQTAEWHQCCWWEQSFPPCRPHTCIIFSIFHLWVSYSEHGSVLPWINAMKRDIQTFLFCAYNSVFWSRLTCSTPSEACESKRSTHIHLRLFPSLALNKLTALNCGNAEKKELLSFQQEMNQALLHDLRGTAFIQIRLWANSNV